MDERLIARLHQAVAARPLGCRRIECKEELSSGGVHSGAQLGRSLAADVGHGLGETAMGGSPARDAARAIRHHQHRRSSLRLEALAKVLKGTLADHPEARDVDDLQGSHRGENFHCHVSSAGLQGEQVCILDLRQGVGGDCAAHSRQADRQHR
eukprot:scaffold1193_cov159-Ochromonas_danica.AAC.24